MREVVQRCLQQDQLLRPEIKDIVKELRPKITVYKYIQMVQYSLFTARLASVHMQRTHYTNMAMYVYVVFIRLSFFVYNVVLCTFYVVRVRFPGICVNSL